MKKALIWTSVVALFIFLLGSEFRWWPWYDHDTTIPTLSTADADDLVARLAKAEKAHGICYGWAVNDGSGKQITVGSNRGIGISANTCEQFAMLTSTINYTSASSESEDSASVTVRTSSGFPYVTSADLSRVGVDTAALLEEPTTATAYGALALPLLLAEKGVVQPLEPEIAATPPATSIGRPGSDFAATHRGAIISLSILGGAAVIGLVIGFILRRKRSQEG